jgi:hypothetical protein
MGAARSRRLAAGLLALSVFSCSYGDREDREEDDRTKRGGPAAAAGVAAPATGAGSTVSGPGLADAVRHVVDDVQA